MIKFFQGAEAVSRPSIHDCNLFCIFVESGERQELVFGLQTTAGRKFWLRIVGLSRMRFDNVQAGNIVFDIGWSSIDRLTHEQIASLYNLGLDAPVQEIEKIRARWSEGKVLIVESSYGCEGLALFKDPVETWWSADSEALTS